MSQAKSLMLLQFLCGISLKNAKNSYFAPSGSFSQICSYFITVPSRKRAHGWCTLQLGQDLGMGRYSDEVSVLHLDVQEHPGKLPILSS